MSWMQVWMSFRSKMQISIGVSILLQVTIQHAVKCAKDTREATEDQGMINYSFPCHHFNGKRIYSTNGLM